MNNVGTVVHTQTNTDDDNVHAGDLNGDAPPVHEARNVHAGEEDTHHDKEGAPPAAKGDQRGDEDADDGNANVLQQLDPHDGVCLPVDVGQGHCETVIGPRDLGHNSLGFSHGWNPNRRGIEPEMRVGNGLQEDIWCRLATRQGGWPPEVWLVDCSSWAVEKLG